MLWRMTADDNLPAQTKFKQWLPSLSSPANIHRSSFTLHRSKDNIPPNTKVSTQQHRGAGIVSVQ